MERIQFGDITIKEVPNDWKNKRQTIAQKRCFEIVITDDVVNTKCYCDNLDKVLLYALELKHEGINGNFAEYADSMLKLDDDAELWR